MSRIHGGFRAGIKMVWMLSAPLFVLCFFAGKWILYAFIDDPTALALQTGIWCAWPIGWTVAALLSLMFYKTGKWNKQKKNG